MQEQILTIGLLAFVRPTFDVTLAARLTEMLIASLQQAGFVVTSTGEGISTADQVESAAQTLVEQPLDVIIAFQSTFADSTMILRTAELLDIPLLLWAVPEMPNGTRLQLNSLCGANLAAHALTRAGHRYNTIYAAPDDKTALKKVRTIALAGRARRMLSTARIGRVGEYPPGFVSCQMNAEALKQRLGVEVIQYKLPAIFDKVRAVPLPQTAEVYEEWNQQIRGLELLDRSGLNGTIATYIALRDLAERDHLDGIAVRCWFQFVEELGCAVCGAQCMLSDELVPATCEADVNGTITQLILQWISGEPVFDSDIVSFDMEANTAIFWHCGKAPLSMADPETRPRAVNHFNFKKPLTLEFPLKPGRVTLARLSEATGEYRLVVGGGEVVRASVSFSGTSGVVRFDRSAQEVLDTILGEGLEHHLALVYGDWIEPLLALAKMLDMPVLRLA
jgi:L-fucose isomerase-like protein